MSTRVRFLRMSLWLPRAAAAFGPMTARQVKMLTRTQDNDEIIARVAALDIGKAELVCCVRVPQRDQPGRLLQEVETYSTMTRPLLGMADHLRWLGVTRVVMEATSDYWKPAFYLLEAAGFERRSCARYAELPNWSPDQTGGSAGRGHDNLSPSRATCQWGLSSVRFR